MTIIRPPAVAGTFYPNDADILRSEIDGLMDAALHSDAVSGDVSPKAIIVPHAGLMFSGSLAALGFATVRALKDTIKRIVIIGPAHRMAFQGIALARADQFATPLGNMRCDLPALQKALALPHVQMLDDAHTLEHGLEIELPFIQRLFGEQSDIGIVPLLVSRCSPRQVHEVIEILWGGPETLIVISSDLSHFHDYDTAKKMDNRTRAMIENFDAENIDTNDACGALPVAGMLIAARNRGMKIKTLGMRNSGDVTGDKSRVVGYGAWAVYDGKALGMGGDGEDDFTKATETLIRTHGPGMLDLCRQSILHGMETGAPLQVAANEVGPELAAPGACFVTLKKAG
ncbi:MAG TPA: AmmeMemoRadiSam system protein B, partial [Thalassospira sp.]|nr:AmmeMemoRadiSam system protein B [Thalassospira sp.]